MDLSGEQLAAVEDIASTSRNFLICGIAGTGKTHCLNECLKRLNLGERASVTAMTGQAASIIKGDTLHSCLGLGYVLHSDNVEDVWSRVQTNFPALQRIRSMKLLVIDEASLLSAQVFSIVEEVLRRGRNSEAAFGGVRIGLLGDFLQLPPVVDKKLLASDPDSQAGSYCFASPAWSLLDPVAFYFRCNQRAVGREWRLMIQNLSEGYLDAAFFEKRKKTLKVAEFHGKEAREKMIICSLRSRVDGIHDLIIHKQSTLSVLRFVAEDHFTIPDSPLNPSLLSKISFADEVVVRRGSRIRFVKKFEVTATPDLRDENASSSRVSVVNGTLATVVGFSNREIVQKHIDRAGLIGRFPAAGVPSNYIANTHQPLWHAVEVILDRTVEGAAPGLTFHVALEEEEVIDASGAKLRRLQVPFVPASASTAHHCQGSTYRQVHIAARAAELFESQHFYVMASRVRKPEDLTIEPDLKFSGLRLGPRDEVKQFYARTFPDQNFRWGTRKSENAPAVLGRKRALDSR